MDFFRTDNKIGKRFIFEVEPRDTILVANKQLSEEKQQKEL